MTQIDQRTALGFPSSRFPDRAGQIQLLLAANGLPVAEDDAAGSLTDVSRGFLETHAEHLRLLKDHRCPADQRIEAFLAEHFADANLPAPLRLPDTTLVLSRHGIARELSLPRDADEYSNEYLTSCRVKNGVLHNPRADRRTTEGTFHVTEGGLRFPATSVPSPRRCSPRCSRRP